MQITAANVPNASTCINYWFGTPSTMHLSDRDSLFLHDLDVDLSTRKRKEKRIISYLNNEGSRRHTAKSNLHHWYHLISGKIALRCTFIHDLLSRSAIPQVNTLYSWVEYLCCGSSGQGVLVNSWCRSWKIYRSSYLTHTQLEPFQCSKPPLYAPTALRYQ